jgi:hypothetical protein
MKYQKRTDAAQIRSDILYYMAKTDAKYTDMLIQCAELEAKYEAVLQMLSTEQMDIICDFLMHCEAMSDRMLELACIHMRFPE